MLDLRLENASVSYAGLGAPVLDIPLLEISAGERVAVTGPSGSGKSTLVNIITGLARPRTGRVLWKGVDIAALPEAARDRWRSQNVGLVMQEFHLFAGLSAIENVLLPARLRLLASADVKQRAHDLLDRVGLKQHQQPIETMSRGEMQRVAVARALLRKPGVLIADEPTASLDLDSGSVVIDHLLALAQAEKAAIIAISHDERLIARMDRRIRLVAGRIADAVKPELAA
jgi:putative ABC transport system ATP-binding protein